MELKVRFTPTTLDEEVSFTVIREREGNIYLHGKHGGVIYSYELGVNDNHTLKFKEESNYSEFQEERNIIDERFLELSILWQEIVEQGFEAEIDEYSIPDGPGYAPDQIFVENKPFSLKQFVDLIDDGDIELAPGFQRNFIWDRTRQSKLIESILLGLPLPSIFLSQYKDGRLTVVDGLQRINTINDFMKDRLRLIGLEYLSQYNGLKYTELRDTLSQLRMRKFGQTQVMCFVIDHRSPSRLKFDLFRRLNTGGRPLNNPEIRNCLARPEVQEVLNQMVMSDAFYEATAGTIKTTRFEAHDAALRFMYFFSEFNENNPIGRYNGDIENTLDDFLNDLNVNIPKGLDKVPDIYENALNNAFYLFGQYSFRKVGLDFFNDRRPPVNKLLMMCISVLLANYDHDFVKEKIAHDDWSVLEELALEINRADGELWTALTYSTNSKRNIHYTFERLVPFFKNRLS